MSGKARTKRVNRSETLSGGWHLASVQSKAERSLLTPCTAAPAASLPQPIKQLDTRCQWRLSALLHVQGAVDKLVHQCQQPGTPPQRASR